MPLAMPSLNYLQQGRDRSSAQISLSGSCSVPTMTVKALGMYWARWRIYRRLQKVAPKATSPLLSSGYLLMPIDLSSLLEQASEMHGPLDMYISLSSPFHFWPWPNIILHIIAKPQHQLCFPWHVKTSLRGSSFLFSSAWLELAIVLSFLFF